MTITLTGSDLATTPIIVQLVGPPKIGANGSRVFQVAYRNTGSVAEANVTLSVTGIPTGVTATGWSGSTPIWTSATGLDFSFTIPILPPSNTYSYFLFALKVDNANILPLVNLQAKATSPGHISNTGTKNVVSVASYDPNDKYGLSGVGTGHYITGSELLPYEIHFENDPLLASAPA